MFYVLPVFAYVTAYLYHRKFSGKSQSNVVFYRKNQESDADVLGVRIIHFGCVKRREALCWNMI